MKINIEKLEMDFIQYNNLLEEYEKIYMNFYYEAVANNRYWHNSKANYFFHIIEEEKLENKIFFEELCLLKSVFEYIIENYSNYGKKLLINIETKDVILNKLNNYKTTKIFNLLIDIDTNVIDITNTKNKLVYMQKDIEQYKEKLKNKYDDIEKLESTINKKISKIILTPVEQRSSLSHQLGDTDENFIDINNLENSVKKLEMYKKEETIIFEDLKEIFNNINYNYITDNKDILENLKIDILSKFKIILENHINNIKLLSNNIEKAKLSAASSNSIFDRMRSSINE